MIVTAEGALKGEELKSVLEQRLPYLDVRVSVLGYIQRGGSPTRFDRLIATLLVQKQLIFYQVVNRVTWLE